MSTLTTSEIPRLIERAKQLEIIVNGLDTFYSPNHVGQKTERHCDKQFNMADSLSMVASLINRFSVRDETAQELSALGFVLDWNYDKLFAMIENDKVKDKPNLFVSKDDIRLFFNFQLAELTDSDLKVLTAVVALHDIGKVNPEWAKGKLNLEGVEFIAHDYDSRLILENNPQLLSIFNLNESETRIVLDLVKLHSLPGQYFFGEGNLAGYKPVLEYARKINSENPLKLARIHGLIDVMSALNHGFVKPILNSHAKMSETISKVYKNGGNLEEAFNQEAEDATKGLASIKEKYGLNAAALYRLMKLTGLTVDDLIVIDSALGKLNGSFIKEFNESTKGETTWYGTYVANAFGSGLKRAFGNKPTKENLESVVCTTVKAISLATQFHDKYGRNSYALSSVKPGLMVVEGKKDFILDELNKFNSLQQGLEYMTNQDRGLYVRGNMHAVEISYRVNNP